jgi:signal transduction histidine kinase
MGIARNGGVVKQDQRLSAVFEVAKVLATEYELEPLLQKLLACFFEPLEMAVAGLLLLYDPADGFLAVRAAHGYDLGSLEQLQLAPGETRCGKAFEIGQPQWYPTPEAIASADGNMSPDNYEVFRVATASLRKIESAVCIPLVAGETKVGVMMLESVSQLGSFLQTDLSFLQAVGAVIAQAVGSASRRQAQLSVQALAEANRLKSELISTLAHELRTPLTSIKGYSTALLMEEATFDAEAQQEFLRIIDQECDVLQNLIHDLLESSIIDAGLLRLQLQPVRLPRLVETVTRDIAHRAPNHRILVDFPDDFPIVDADPDRLAQVLRNILDNAVKYSPEGGLVFVRSQVHEDEIVISVADQGTGLAPEHLNRLFEKFFRVDSGLGRRVVGSGLGLPIARTIVESHGGRIWAESQLGQGTTLFFTLPLMASNRDRRRSKER